jgi:hypothetical protein
MCPRLKFGKHAEILYRPLPQVQLACPAPENVSLQASSSEWCESSFFPESDYDVANMADVESIFSEESRVSVGVLPVITSEIFPFPELATFFPICSLPKLKAPPLPRAPAGVWRVYANDFEPFSPGSGSW